MNENKNVLEVIAETEILGRRILMYDSIENPWFVASDIADWLGVKNVSQLINDHGEFIHNVLAGKGDEIVRNMPVISLKSDDFGRIIRMLTDDVDKYQAAINMANELRVI